MALKDLKEASEKDKVIFGLRETLKAAKGKKGKTKLKVFITSDARPEILKQLQEKEIDSERVKTKQDVAKELGLDFECEVFSLK